MWTDELDAARSIFNDLEKRCREGGDEGSLAVILFLLAQLECSAGNWSEAIGYAEESFTITVWTGQQPYRALALSARALVEGHRGRVQAARAAAEEGLELARQSGLVQASQFNLWALGFIELSLGNVKETHRLLWPLAEGVLTTGLGDPGMLRFLPDEIEALVDLGETDRARSLLQPTLARAKTLGRAWARATAERGWGLLAASLGELPERSALSTGPWRVIGSWTSPSSSGGRCSHRAKYSAARKSGGSRGTRSVGRWRSSSTSGRISGPTRPGPTWLGSEAGLPARSA